MNAVIMLCKCNKTKEVFAIRLEEHSKKEWHATWSFIINEASAKREKYDQTIIKGNFYTNEKYPGCPLCKSKSFWQCGACRKMNCYNGESTFNKCAWCKETGEIKGTIKEILTDSDI